MQKQIKKTIPYTFTCLIIFFTVVLTCCKKADPEKAIETGSLTDVDGNIYETVKIGDQWWMAEDLRVEHYRNQQPIEKIMYSASNDSFPPWANIKKGAFTNFAVGSKTVKFYNWYAIKDSGNIAPAGWHIPSDAEWKALEKNLGMSEADADKTNFRGAGEGDKLKKTGLIYWNAYDDVWATNESGFSALASGCIMFNGAVAEPNYKHTGFWWSATEYHDNTAWYRHLDYKKSGVFRFYGNKNYGFSVRCIKD